MFSIRCFWRTFQSYRSSLSVSTPYFQGVFTGHRRDQGTLSSALAGERSCVSPVCRAAAPVTALKSQNILTTACDRGALSSYESISCSGLGLGRLALWPSVAAIKRLDCASSDPHPYRLSGEAVVYLEYPRTRPDANSLQTLAVGLLLAANDKIDFSKGFTKTQPGACGNCG